MLSMEMKISVKCKLQEKMCSLRWIWKVMSAEQSRSMVCVYDHTGDFLFRFD